MRMRLSEKNDQLTTAKMKIDELRILKNDSVNLATTHLQEKLQNTVTECQKYSQIIEGQNHEVCIFIQIILMIFFPYKNAIFR